MRGKINTWTYECDDPATPHRNHNTEEAMDWLARMNWSFLETNVAERVWDEARRLYFEEDDTLEQAFTKGLEGEGMKPERKR